MIEAKNLTKRFGDTLALKNMNCQIGRSSIFGLVGSNGAGKSTFMRLVAGIYRPDKGEVLINAENVYENVDMKTNLILVPDSPFFFRQATLQDMAEFYSKFYPSWDQNLFNRLRDVFPLSLKKQLANLSKGSQRQAALMLGVSVRPELILLDEAFDGLDPVMRQVVRQLLAEEVEARGQTVVISSHNLRELEDFCDHVGLLHEGGIIFEREIDQLKHDLSKIQVAFNTVPDKDALIEAGLDILSYQSRGRLLSTVIRGDRNEIRDTFLRFNPLFLDVLPLTLEEVFIEELEQVGYDVRSILA